MLNRYLVLLTFIDRETDTARTTHFIENATSAEALFAEVESKRVDRGWFIPRIEEPPDHPHPFFGSDIDAITIVPVPSTLVSKAVGIASIEPAIRDVLIRQIRNHLLRVLIASLELGGPDDIVEIFEKGIVVNPGLARCEPIQAATRYLLGVADEYRVCFEDVIALSPLPTFYCLDLHTRVLINAVRETRGLPPLDDIPF